MWITGYSPTINYIGKFSFQTQLLIWLDHADLYLIMEYFPSKKGTAYIVPRIEHPLIADLKTKQNSTLYRATIAIII